MTEQQIIEGLRVSDEGAYKFVFVGMFAELCYFADSMVHNKHAAEDIAMESLVAFWKREKDGFKTLGNVRGFLYTSTRNACINYLKQKKNYTLSEAAIAHLANDNSDWENLSLEAQVLQAVYAKIEELPEGCKQVFKLAYLDGVKRADIAIQLNLSEHTVRNHIVRALRILRLKLTDKEMIVAYLLFLEMHELGFHNYTRSLLT